jgi:O-6-methylguanine DNA methyltransferase
MKMNRTIMNTSSRVTDTRSQARASSNEIAFSFGESPLGVVSLACSVEGICAILIGSQTDELKSDLAACFPGAKLVRRDEKLADDLQKILRFIETPAQGLDLPLDIRGTPFQRRVWDALLGIPAGSTVTYSALAARVGQPKSVRAVANACAANALALAIPCHRVVRSNGILSGYRWGVERKRALIAKEVLV